MRYKTKGMRLMGRRFVPDSYMFQHIVYPKVGSYMGDPKKLPFTSGSDGMGGFYRAYIRGLDLMALLGSSEALDILADEEDTNYLHYGLRFGKMKKEFDDLSKTDCIGPGCIPCVAYYRNCLKAILNSCVHRPGSGVRSMPL